MSNFSRRKFLCHVGLAGTTLPLVTVAKSETPKKLATKDGAPQKLAGIVHGLGIHGRLFPGMESGPSRDVNIVTSLNLGDGSIRQTPVRMREGHAAMSLGDGRVLCIAQHEKKSLVLDPLHKQIAGLICPEMFVYSGHALILPQRNIFVMTARDELQLTDKAHGLLLVYNLTTLQLLDRIPSGGLQPHELHPIPNASELALTHYGDVFSERKPFEHNVADAKLTILDSTTLKPKRHYVQNDFSAMVTHMQVDDEGWAYAVLTQYIRWPSSRDSNRDELVRCGVTSAR